MDYHEFLQSKLATVHETGIDVQPEDIMPSLFLFQRDIVRWALRLGKAAMFEECGLGKTPQQLEWARQVTLHTGGTVLILSPLAVAGQTVREGNKFNIPVTYCREQADIQDHNIVVTNYERLEKFNPESFTGVVLDESSILKAYTGKTKQFIIDAFRNTPYKLTCTATPAPNDHLELGNHADFLDVMPSNEMISRWFINDTMQAGNYRLKAHAASDFWRWLTSWAVCISRPGDLGPQYEMAGFDLPELALIEHYVGVSGDTLERTWSEGRLLPDSKPSATTLHKVKRESLSDRVEEARRIVASIPSHEPVIIWCDTNYEADALQDAFPGAAEVRGNHTTSVKESTLRRFSNGEVRLIITKPDIAGFGLNWQHCSNQVFVGVSYSFEKTYQALRRSYRFGQTKPVQAHLIYSEAEGGILTTLQSKQEEFKIMQSEMNAAMAQHGLFRDDARLTLTIPNEKVKHSENWTMYLGDCVEVARQLPDNSVDFGIHSPPFANLYIYSDSVSDMGNSADDDEFFTHYGYLIKDLYRITQPGRLCAVHCKDLPAYMNRDGAAGLIDFPGRIIREFERHGWQYHSRVTIWKDPVIEMQRTKNHGLLHKNFEERAEACRQGMPDYLIVFRKWPIDGGAQVKQQREVGDYIGTNPPLPDEVYNRGRFGENKNYSIAVWQRYASPVWFDIDQTNVLNYQLAKTDKDEKHICPLQLDVIARSIDLWTNPGDVVFSPFAGIGSEGDQAVRMRRKFIGVELKPEYFDIAVRNLQDAERAANQVDLFTWANIQKEEAYASKEHNA